MERITTSTTLADYKEWLLELGCECEDRSEGKALYILRDDLRIYMTTTKGDNVMFIISFQQKDELSEIDIYRKINEINFGIISGCLAYYKNSIQFTFSLIKPYGMGQKGFSVFLDYNIKLIKFIVEHMGLAEIID
ncbi:hypothetical protein [Atlantibacter hermannii]|uniref:Uncharacterized protein n=1 Tax=Atlantibacter hermannii NBRC 105704 TaxID=1115512 RepID=H5UWH9_ATLHE|nr:hypothetical protein [Atlantibacter hermannii]QPS90197.1 hypothetical protein I6G45_11540 [Atlantibacter hermannii]GAB50260.1 hypothetical protein EH105704_01_02670 [Atlantibacter hermannii NBRC 105704]VDZ72967.1 Uncharacterised protein [Atlantibacter hermannii]